MNSDQGIVGYSAMEPDWSSEVGKGLLISQGNNLNFRRQAPCMNYKGEVPENGVFTKFGPPTVL
jgi:hypothetical protein